MKIKSIILINFLVIGTIAPQFVIAEDAFEAPILKDGLIDRYNTYPPSERNMARTGRVSVSFMVGKDGRPYEVMVEQANNSKFIKPTIKSMLSGRYEPATKNGQPIDVRLRTVERFNIGFDSRSPYVSTKNMNKYMKKFSDELNKENPSQKALTKYLKRMAGTKHGSQLAQKYLSYNRYKYALKFGNTDDQIIAAREVLLSANEGRRVREYADVRTNLIGLLVNAGRLGEAQLEYFEARRNLGGSERSNIVDKYTVSMEQIEEIINSDKGFERAIKIGERGFTYLPLIKSTFSLDEIDGSITAMKLRCAWKFAELEFKATAEYKVPGAWGNCQLQLIGEKGTSAKLIQY